MRKEERFDSEEQHALLILCVSKSMQYTYHSFIYQHLDYDPEILYTCLMMTLVDWTGLGWAGLSWAGPSVTYSNHFFC